jgi:hypothetical protein
VWFRGNLLGTSVLDRDGRLVGTVENTRPSDGSDAEFAVVRIGFGTRVLVPVAGVRVLDRVAQFPYTADAMAAAPGPDGMRFDEDAVLCARAYWGMHRPEFDRIAYESVGAV